MKYIICWTSESTLSEILITTNFYILFIAAVTTTCTSKVVKKQKSIAERRVLHHIYQKKINYQSAFTPVVIHLRPNLDLLLLIRQEKVSFIRVCLSIKKASPHQIVRMTLLSTLQAMVKMLINIWCSSIDLKRLLELRILILTWFQQLVDWSPIFIFCCVKKSFIMYTCYLLRPWCSSW